MAIKKWPLNKFLLVFPQVLCFHVSKLLDKPVQSRQRSMFLAGNIKSIGSFFATEHVNRVLSEASFVQLQNGGLQFFRGANNSYKFVRGIAQKIVIFVQVRVFQESLLISSRAPLKIQFCLMPSRLGDDICCIVRLLLLSTLTIGISKPYFGCIG